MSSDKHAQGRLRKAVSIAAYLMALYWATMAILAWGDKGFPDSLFNQPFGAKAMCQYLTLYPPAVTTGPVVMLYVKWLGGFYAESALGVRLTFAVLVFIWSAILWLPLMSLPWWRVRIKVAVLVQAVWWCLIFCAGILVTEGPVIARAVALLAVCRRVFPDYCMGRRRDDVVERHVRPPGFASG